MEYKDNYESTQENLKKDIEGILAPWIELLRSFQKKKLNDMGVIEGNSINFSKNVVVLNNPSSIEGFIDTELREKIFAKVDSLPGGGKGVLINLIKKIQGRSFNTKEFELDDYLYTSSHIGLNSDRMRYLANRTFMNRAEWFSKDRQTFLYNYINYDYAQKFINKAWKSGQDYFRSTELIYNRKKGNVGNYGLSVDIIRDPKQTMTIDGVGAVSSIKSPVAKKETSGMVVFADIIDILKMSFLRDFKKNKLTDTNRIIMREREIAILFYEKFLPALAQADVIIFNEDYIKSIPKIINEVPIFKERVNSIITELPDVRGESHSPGLAESHRFIEEVQKKISKGFL